MTLLRPGRRRVVLVWLAACVAAVAILAVIGWPARAYRDFDFFPFWAAGRLLLVGANAYDADVLRAAFVEGGSLGHAFGGPFAYPLPAAILSLPYALMPFDLAAPMWLVSQLALCAAALWSLSRRLFGRHLRRDAPLLFALVGSMPATVQTVAIGNVGGFLLAITAGALALLLARRPMRAGAVLGLGVFKPHVFLVLAPMLLVRSRYRVFIALGGATTSLGLVAVSFLVQPGWLGGWLGAIDALGSKEVAHANVWGPFPPEWRWLGWVLLAALGIATIAWSRRVRPSVAEGYGAAVALSLLAAPYLWTHYFTMLAVPIAVVLAAAPDTVPRRSVALVSLALSSVVVPWVLYADTYRTGQEPFGAVVPIALFGLIVVLTGRRASSGPPVAP